MKSLAFKKDFLYALGAWFLAICMLLITRGVLLYGHTSEALRQQNTHDITSMWIWGLRFDIKAATIVFGSVFLLSLFSLLTPKSRLFWQQNAYRCYAFLLWLVACISIADVFYFKTYDRQFDVFIFGLVEDDTQAILKTFWSDYPVIRIVLAYAFLAYLLKTIVFKYHQWINQLSLRTRSYWHTALTSVMILLAIVLGVRGSIGTFPLRQDDAQISSVNILNAMVSNGLMSLHWAVNDQKQSNQFTKVSDEEGVKLISQLMDEKKTADLKQLIQSTPENLAAKTHQPNVVLTVMESMGEHLNQYDKSDRDVLGALRQHFQEDWLYSRFVSEGDGTSDSLHRFFIRSPLNNISQSNKQNTPFLSNMFKPYLDAGYDVVYLTAGNGAWRNFNRFLPQLGVTEVVEENTLRQRYPEAIGNTWGVPDEYMFRYAKERLAQAERNGKPVFIMMMSITHHPPFELPHTATQKTFHFSSIEQERLQKLAVEPELNRIFNTLFYSNNALGEFFSTVKADPQLRQNTIMAATGDHNIRAIGYPDPKEQVLHHAVPFYLYVPKPYQQHAVFDMSRVGSHKDIMPTLYALSLSQVPFYQNGCNITAKNLDKIWCNAGYNPNILLTPKGAYNLETGTYHYWQDHQGVLLKEASAIDMEEKALIKRWQAFTPFLTWQLNRQIMGQ